VQSTRIEGSRAVCPLSTRDITLGVVAQRPVLDHLVQEQVHGRLRWLVILAGGVGADIRRPRSAGASASSSNAFSAASRSSTRRLTAPDQRMDRVAPGQLLELAPDCLRVPFEKESIWRRCCRSRHC
jgi:hypothetical protein